MPVHAIDQFKVQAEDLLKRVAIQIQPIMRKRQLRVPLLSEFYPRHANLLGINCGGGAGATQEIKLRLRHAGNPNEFLPFTSLLGTMLHELCHNHIGPHNRAFFSLLEELQTECEDLMARGVTGTGAGFDAAAAGRIGGRWRNPSDAEKRLAMLQAAEKRNKDAAALTRLMPPGPQKLGGASSAAPPAKAAALAAMDRQKAAEACGCDEEHGTQVTYDDARGEVIILEDEGDEENERHNTDPRQPCSSSHKTGKRPVEQHQAPGALEPEGVAKPALRGSSGAQPRDLAGRSNHVTISHAAENSTASNEASVANDDSVIDLTLLGDDSPSPAAKPKNPKKTRQELRDEGAGWQCQKCTFINASGAERCSMCDTICNF